MTTVSYVEGVMGLVAAESAQGKTEDGSKQIEDAETKRKALRVHMRHLQEEQKRLQAELDEAMDTNAFEDAWNWLTGSDSGVGDIQDDMATKAAHMKKMAHEIQVAQTEVQQAMNELNQATNELGARANERQKAIDESDRNVQVMMS